MNKLSRNKEVDIAKGIGIILVVVGHAGCIPELKNFIFTFHMALFFILSGLFINPVSTIVGGG